MKLQNKTFLYFLVILVLFIGCLFLVIPNVYEESTKTSIDRYNLTKMRNIKIVLDLYKVDYGEYPSADEGLNVIHKVDGYQDFEIEKLQDAWGKSFHYSKSVDGTSIRLWTYGKDEKSGGKELDEDLALEAP